MYQVSEKRPAPLIEAPAIRQPEDAIRLIRNGEIIPAGREAFIALFLNTRHNIISPPYVVSIGSINASIVHPRELFREAIIQGSAAIIVAHNHPSGNVRPSSDDLDLTSRLDKCGGLLGIPLLDHLIIGDNEEFLSIREDGWPPKA